MAWWRKGKAVVDSSADMVPVCCAAHGALSRVAADGRQGYYVEMYWCVQYGALQAVRAAELTDTYSRIAFPDGSIWQYGARADGSYGYVAYCPSAARHVPSV
jgi:hypothetical protein